MTARPEITGRRTGRRLLTFADLKERGIPWSRVHVRRLELSGQFPQHIEMGENTICWFEDEIDEFIEAKARARRPIHTDQETSVSELARGEQ
jgi:prophage regulatory protein